MKNIYKWYEINKRELPWRETKDPYKIWVSEIILQQTRVNQGISYYKEFISHFPDIHSLAKADEDEVLKLWQGLGYYSRARNMHLSARMIVNKFNGSFPSDYITIKSLKGIGPYTAAAIGSIAFNLPFPVLDGNVIRFLARYFGIIEPVDVSASRKQLEKIVWDLLDKNNPGIHNQAMMEFGALQCIPKNPDCSSCILNSNCIAFRQNIVEMIPLKSKKIDLKTRYFHYLLFETDASIIIQKRINTDIWKNLFQLPLIETPVLITPEEFLKSNYLKDFLKKGTLEISGISSLVRHVLTHQIILARFYHIKSTEEFLISDGNIEILKEDISKFAVPKLIETYLKEKGLIEKNPTG